MPTKSRTCTGAVSKAPLTEYASEDEARAGAAYALARHGSTMVPYLCDLCHRPTGRANSNPSLVCSRTT